MCGYGWRAYDLAYYYTRIAEPSDNSPSMADESVRPICASEREVFPTFGQAAWVKERTMMGTGLDPRDLAKCLEDPYES